MRRRGETTKYTEYTKNMPEIIYANESYRIMGVCMEVYKEKGCGFLEAVFQECVEIEMRDQGIPFTMWPILPLSYKGHALRQTYSPDFVCFDKIILELKSVSKLADEHRAQV